MFPVDFFHLVANNAIFPRLLPLAETLFRVRRRRTFLNVDMGWLKDPFPLCLEHYEYVKKYLDILLSEYEFRFGKQHGLTKFLEWEEVDAPKLSIPNGNIKKICLPWKCLDPRWRRKDIIEGYRLQFMSSFEDDDAFKAYNGSRRDMPDFVVKHFKLDVAGIE